MTLTQEPLVILLAGWSSGISVYLTAGLLGLCGKLGWISLPGNLKILSNPLIFIPAFAIFAVEFFADKIPYVDSAWDSAHTFIRPLGSLAIGYAAGSEQGAVAQVLYAMLAGTLTLNMHAAKAAGRLAINTSPEPFSNIALSIAENSLVFFMYWFFIRHPYLAAGAIIIISVLAFLLVRLLWNFSKKIFGWGKNVVKQQSSIN
jgi:hypothetical protein